MGGEVSSTCNRLEYSRQVFWVANFEHASPGDLKHEEITSGAMAG